MSATNNTQKILLTRATNCSETAAPTLLAIVDQEVEVAMNGTPWKVEYLYIRHKKTLDIWVQCDKIEKLAKTVRVCRNIKEFNDTNREVELSYQIGNSPKKGSRRKYYSSSDACEKWNGRETQAERQGIPA